MWSLYSTSWWLWWEEISLICPLSQSIQTIIEIFKHCWIWPMRTQIDFERRLGYWQPEEVIVVVLPAFFLHRGNNLPSQKKLNFHFKSNSRNMHWIPVGASLFASNIGSEHFIGNRTIASLQAFFLLSNKTYLSFQKIKDSLALGQLQGWPLPPTRWTQFSSWWYLDGKQRIFFFI